MAYEKYFDRINDLYFSSRLAILCCEHVLSVCLFLIQRLAPNLWFVDLISSTTTKETSVY